MNFKFRNLLMTAGALLAFTACSNDSDGIPQEPEAQLSDVSVRIEIPGAAGQAGTRGIVEDPITKDEDKKAKADKAIAYLMDGTTKVAESEVLTLDKGVAKHTFVGVFVSGKEKVRVIAYNEGKAVEADLNYEVYNLQPVAASEGITAMPGITNSVYSGEDGLGTATSDASGKKIYKVDFNMNSLTARLELMGRIGFNKDLVKELNLVAITPIKFREKNLDTKVITPKDDLNKLWYKAEDSHYTDADGFIGGKALANHLFAGDQLAFSIGIQPTLYVCEKDINKAYVKLKYSGDASDEKYSAVYQDKADSNILYIYNKEENAFYNVTKTGDKYSIGNKAESVNFENIKLETAVLQFFNMAGDKLITEGKYTGGKIYKIQLNDLKWGDSNNYSPDVNTGNPEEPEEKEEADVIVTATVVDWTEQNTTAGLE